MTWFERFPDRFEYELAGFERHGLAFDLDEELLQRERRVVLRGTLQVEGEPEPVPLVVVYPDGFPFFRPEVFAPGLALNRHQNPFERNLCLLDRSTRAWSPRETAAHLVATQVPHLLKLVRTGGEEMREGEVAQGEPVSYYFPPLAGTVVWIPDELLALPREHRAGLGRISFGHTEPPQLRLRGLLSSAAVREQRGRTRKLAAVEGALAHRFSAGSIEMRWVRLGTPPRSRDPEDLLRQAAEAAPRVNGAPWQQVGGGHIAVTGLVFEEEIRQGEFADTWLFVVALRDRPTPGMIPSGWYLTRGERLSDADLLARIPKMAPLADKRVALIGLGALGAPIALELARAQIGELRILDFDYVETGTIVRWPFGLSAVAAPKVDFLTQVLPREYPFTTVAPFPLTIGSALQLDGHAGKRESDFQVIDRMFDGVDLVIDASAEIGIQQFIAHLADERGIPQLTVSATEGARGGIVARIIPNESGCWLCLQQALYEGEIEIPPHDEMGTVQPRGCGSSTFTGTAFDLLPIVAQAVRLAVTTLLDGRSGADIFVCSLTNPSGAPQWAAHELERRSSCSGCGTAIAA
jgi:molybdopterin/thiamine biosynthesis adenylyltransferase